VWSLHQRTGGRRRRRRRGRRRRRLGGATVKASLHVHTKILK